MKRYGKNIKIHKDDIYKYIFIYIYLSVYNLHEIDMLWKKTKFFQTIIPQIISKRSYKTINKYFYISSYSDLITPNINQNNKTEKIDELLLYINKKWKSMYPYTQHITIDESMANYKGKI